MIFALLTLLAALALAAVAGWFSIVGFMAIYAGAPMYALIMGVVTECAKLVTASWLYRNWQHAGWRLKAPLVYFTLALMTATSIGVFGFLSKAHLEQGAGTIDNSSKIEQLQYQIDREKATIADNEKVTKQLDDTVNSLLGKDRADRALSVRKSQASQRAQLRADSAEAQKRIDTLSAEKFKFESEVRKMQLEVGPIRYIAELFYGVDENATKNIEAAVRIFTLLLVSTLDPLAVILLIAANHTLIRLRNEKKEKDKAPTPGFFDRFRKRESPDEVFGQDANKTGIVPNVETAERIQAPEAFVPAPSSRREEAEVDVSLPHKTVEVLDEKEIISQGPQEISFPQIDDVIEGRSVVMDGETVPETEVTEDLVGSREVNTSGQVSIIAAELQEQVPVSGALLNEEQESPPAWPENDSEVPEEARTYFQWAPDWSVSDAPPSFPGETVDQAETYATIAENTEILSPVQVNEKEDTILENFTPTTPIHSELHIVRTPSLSRINGEVEAAPVPQVPVVRVPWAQQDTVLQELLGNVPHFAPQRLNEKEIIHGAPDLEGKNGKENDESAITTSGPPNIEALQSEGQTFTEETSEGKEYRKISLHHPVRDKYPKALSWLTEFRRL